VVLRIARSVALSMHFIHSFAQILSDMVVLSYNLSRCTLLIISHYQRADKLHVLTSSTCAQATHRPAGGATHRTAGGADDRTTGAAD
jgi:hypothetical protein